jgi:hypothetical protein
MNNFKTTIITLFAFIAIATACCKKPAPAPTKDKYGLPLPTQTGANTFGCLIDGVPFVVEGEYNWLTGDGLEASFSIQDSIFRLRAKAANPKKNFMICCKIRNGVKGQHQANEYLTVSYSYLSLDGSTIPGQGGYFIANENLQSTITISETDITMTTLDTKGKIISGAFDLTLAKSDGTIIHITEGRFDYKFK